MSKNPDISNRVSKKNKLKNERNAARPQQQCTNEQRKENARVNDRKIEPANERTNKPANDQRNQEKNEDNGTRRAGHLKLSHAYEPQTY